MSSPKSKTDSIPILIRIEFRTEIMPRAVSTLSFGSLFTLFQTLSNRFVSAGNIAYLIGFLRVNVFHQQSSISQEEVVNRRSLRNKLLERFPNGVFELLSKSETARSCRFSIMCYFESLQSETICKNIAIHLLDCIISEIFPEIRVWSHFEKEQDKNWYVC